MAGGYVSVQLDKSQQKEIQQLLGKADLDSIDDMHCTLMYDESNPDIDYDTKEKETYTAKVTGIEKLGKAIVLLLDSPELTKRHKELKKLGFEHSYDDLLCHMSVIYDPESTDLDVVELMYKLEVFPEVLTFTSEKNVDLED